MSDYLLEIGVENIPASYIAPAVRQLRDDMRAALSEERLDFDDVYASGTPRRLTVMVHGLADKQRAAEETLTGPPVSKAFDEEGNPTRAAEGFARSQSTTVDELEQIETPKGLYLGVRRKLSRRGTAAILRERMPVVVAGLRFPKSMKWEPSGARFARPVRWIVSLLGAKVVAFEFAGVKTGNRTWKRPWMKGETAMVRSAGTYSTVMKKLGIILDQDERRGRIVALAERAAEREGGRMVEDEGLIDELTFMLEDPQVMVGGFPEHYLELPSEVVTTAMRSHQRYIAVKGSRGKLAPKFITFTDAKVLGAAEVRHGFEKVLNARLADASFYWQEDLSRGMDGLSDELDRIVFIEGLGTIGEKRRRVARVAGAVNHMMPESERADDADVERATRLAKADLASEMIKDGKEFTLLQGVIGAHYARASKESPAVVTAIREHYQPRTPGDRVPASALGAAVGIADRIDTICGCFIAGFKPTGSQDPYALRRSANGLIRIARAREGVELDRLIDAALDGYQIDFDRGAVRTDLVEFFTSRCEAFLRDNGVPYDVANAVVPLTWARPGVALDRARDIARLRGDAVFERLITGVKRVGNILSGEGRRMGAGWEEITGALGDDHGGFDVARFEDSAEHDLLAAVRDALPDVETAEAGGAFSSLLERLSKLADPIDAYFDNVLVNAPDEAVRRNRHAFLASVYALFARYADFSAIVEEGAPD